MSKKPKCPKCRTGRKCKKGQRLHAEATRYLLENGMEYDDKHEKLYKRYLEHQPNEG